MELRAAAHLQPLADLPPEMAACCPAVPDEEGADDDLLSLDFKSARAAFEARYLTARLRECGGNVTRLAESVGLERSYLHRKLKGLGLRTE